MGTEDKIVILIEAVDKTNKALSDLKSNLGSVKNEAMSFGKLLGGITLGDQLSKAISLVADKLRDASKASLKFLGDLETFGLSIASSLLVGGKYVDQMTGKALDTAGAFKIARGEATGILESLQVANFQTIATLDQLTRVFVETMPIALNKGFNIKQVQDFTLATVQAAGAIGLEMDMIAEETRAMLTPSINPRFSRVAVALGLTNEDIRQHSQNAETLFTFLMGKLEAFSIAGIETQNTWKGLWSNLKDVGLQLGGKLLQPLFEEIKLTIKEVIDSVVTLDTKAGKIVWNPEFLSGIEKVKYTIFIILDSYDEFSQMMLKTVGTLTSILYYLALVPDLLTGKIGKSGGWSEYFRNLNEQEEQAYIDLDKKRQNRVYRSMGLDPTQVAIRDAASTYKVDPNLIRGLISVESSGNPNAVNPKTGATGLMQIMPTTGHMLAQKMKIIDAAKYKPSDLKDVETNIQMGTYYISTLLKKHGGDVDKALAEYGGFVTKDPTDYINKVKKASEEARKGGAVKYEANNRLSSQTKDELKSEYDIEQKLTMDHSKKLIEINKDQTDTLLKEQTMYHKTGQIAEEDFFNKKKDIVVNGANTEIAALEDTRKKLTDTWRGSLLVEPDKFGIFGDKETFEKEKAKFSENIEWIDKEISKRKNVVKEALFENTSDLAVFSLKQLEANDKTQRSYADMSDKIATAIDKLKVKRNEMAPGDALVAETERQLTTIEDQYNRTLEIMRNLTPGSEEWLKLVEVIKQLKVQLIELGLLKEEKVLEGGLLNVEKKQQTLITINQEKIAVAELKGEMDKIPALQYEILIAELKIKEARATEDQKGAIREQIQFYQDLLTVIENSGPAWAGFKEGARETFNELNNHFQRAKENVKTFVNNVRTAFSDTLFNVLKGDFDNFGQIWDTLLNNMYRQLADNWSKDIINAFSTMWSGVANESDGWLQSMLKTVAEWVKQVIAQLMAVKAAGSGGGAATDIVGWFGGGSGGGSEAGAAAIDIVSAAHKGGFIPRYHVGGRLKSDERHIIAQTGEYMLSKEDVDFVNKVKSGGPTINVNMGGGASQKPTIVPMGITVMVDNSSSAMLQANSRTRQVGDAQYIIDVVLRDINNRGKLARM